MLCEYNRTSQREIDVLNGNMRPALTAPTAVCCFAPVNGLAAQRKIRKSIHMELTRTPIFRVGGARSTFPAAPPKPFYAEANPFGFA